MLLFVASTLQISKQKERRTNGGRNWGLLSIEEEEEEKEKDCESLNKTEPNSYRSVQNNFKIDLLTK